MSVRRHIRCRLPASVPHARRIVLYTGSRFPAFHKRYWCSSSTTSYCWYLQTSQVPLRKKICPDVPAGCRLRPDGRSAASRRKNIPPHSCMTRSRFFRFPDKISENRDHWNPSWKTYPSPSRSHGRLVLPPLLSCSSDRPPASPSCPLRYSGSGADIPTASLPPPTECIRLLPRTATGSPRSR